MKKSQNKFSASNDASKLLSNVIKVEQNASKLGGIISKIKLSTAAHGAATGAGKAGLGFGHAGMAAGGGAGGGFFLGKAYGLKLGLGLAGFGGPLILAGVLGLGSYGLYKFLKSDRPDPNKTGTDDT